MTRKIQVIRIVFVCLHFAGHVNSSHSLFAKEAESFTDHSKSKEDWSLVFQEEFSNDRIGSEPENLFILDGAFSVGIEEKNLILVLPGNPVGEFGFLFGPRLREKSMELQFSFKSENKGRRYPSFAACLGGVRGFRVRLNPAYRKMILYYEDEHLEEVPFTWKSKKWYNMRIQAVRLPTKQSMYKIKLWQASQNEPLGWHFTYRAEIEFESGKCAVWGYPYSGLSICFDNLNILAR